MRETASEAQKPEGGSIKHDISVPIARIPEFLERAAAVVEAVCPGARPVAFGHFGDGNVHYNVSQPPGMDKAAFLALWEQMSGAVHDLVAETGRLHLGRARHRPDEARSIFSASRARWRSR